MTPSNNDHGMEIRAWDVTGGRMFKDRLHRTKEAAEEAVKVRKDGSELEPLVRLSDAMRGRNKLHAALEFAHSVAASELQPFKGLMSNESTEYSCWGCEGKFMSFAPSWKEPTVETFGHLEGCKYVSYLAVIASPETKKEQG